MQTASLPALAQAAVWVDADMSDFSCHISLAAVDLPANHQTGADSRADIQERHPLHAAACSQNCFRLSSGFHLVVQTNLLDSGCLPQQVNQIHLFPL